MKYTTNYKFKKPEGTEPVNFDDINDSFDLIDETLRKQDDILETDQNKINDLNTNITKVSDDLASHKADITNKLNNLNTNDVEARCEILDLKLKLDEQQVLAFLNKTGIGFYDLFKNIDSIDTTNTTATIADTDVTFEGNKLLKFKQQQFSTFNNVELAVYDKDRQYINIDTDISNSNTIQVTVPPDSIIAGDKFYVNGQIYTVTSVQLA